MLTSLLDLLLLGEAREVIPTGGDDTCVHGVVGDLVVVAGHDLGTPLRVDGLSLN